MSDCGSLQGSLTKSPYLNDGERFQMSPTVPWPNFPMESRIRVLRLIRPFPTCRSNMFSTSSNLSFGFTVRGGKEHGTGFFVSHVEKNSEADLKGLQLGDQILWVNQFRIDNAVHKEFVQMISSQDCITLKVRNTGVLPIKDKKRDFLYWYEMTGKEEATEDIINSNAYVEAKSQNDITVFLHVEPGSRLGLGICKGPAWKPGIFVLFTKENSLAHRAGLRAGDQILSVNSISFANILFSEAVSVMKSSNKLKILVRTVNKCDFVAGTTTNHNSSSAENSLICDDSVSKRNMRTSNLDAPNDHYSPNFDMKKEFNKTVIELVGNSKQDQCNNNNNTNTNSASGRDFKSTANATKHEGNLETKSTSNVPAAPPACTTLKVVANNNKNNNCFVNKAGVGYNSSLSSAIEQEIKKRKEKMNKNSTETIKLENHNKSTPEVRQISHKAAHSAQAGTNNNNGNNNNDNVRSALVDEFKRVHHRMVLKIKDNGQMVENLI